MNASLLNGKNILLPRKKTILVSLETERTDFVKRVENTLGSYDVSYEEPKINEGDFTGGKGTYTISPINSRDKYSAGFFDCTGIVCTGISQFTGEKISFLSHQDPIKLLDEYQDNFDSALSIRLKEMVELAYPETIDIGIFGGNINNCDIYTSNYTEVIKYIRSIVKKILGNDLDIIIGPSIPQIDENTRTLDTSSDFYYNNSLSVLFRYKPPQKTYMTDISFPAVEVYDVLSFVV